jgi:hypothetical protein
LLIKWGYLAMTNSVAIDLGNFEQEAFVLHFVANDCGAA